MNPDCHNCTEKCPQAERAHETAMGRMYATKEFLALVKKIESGQLVEVKAIQRLLNSECARLYRADEEMIKNMGGYNPSSFIAGYQYALDCIIGKFTQIKGERETDGRI